jgi:hypothetical protein
MITTLHNDFSLLLSHVALCCRKKTGFIDKAVKAG